MQSLCPHISCGLVTLLILWGILPTSTAYFVGTHNIRPEARLFCLQWVLVFIHDHLPDRQRILGCGCEVRLQLRLQLGEKLQDAQQQT